MNMTLVIIREISFHSMENDIMSGVFREYLNGFDKTQILRDLSKIE